MSGGQRATYWRSAWVRWGLGVFVAATLPLLVVGILSGRGANPIGLGLLFVAGVIVGSLLALIGVVKTL